MSTKERTKTKGLSSHNLKHLLNIADEVKASMIHENYTWIYDSIVDRIHEVGSKEEEMQKVLFNIISEYQEEGRYNESIINVLPDEATIGKNDKRIENEILLFKIGFIQEVLNILITDQELSSSFFKVNILRKGLTELASVKKLNENGIKTRAILEYIKKHNIVSHIIALFYHLGFLDYIQTHYNCKNHMDVSREVYSWMAEGTNKNTVEKAVRYYMNNGENDKQFDNPLKLVQKAFPLD